jgi:hypothetical protein
MTCSISKKQLFPVMLLCGVAALACLAMVFWGKPAGREPGWILFGIFSFLTMGISIQIRRVRPVLFFTDQGIEDKRLNIGVIPWEEIRGISVTRLKHSTLLGVDVIDPEKYLAKMPGWQQAIFRANKLGGLPPITMGLGYLEPGVNEVVAYLRNRVPVIK